MLLTAFIDVDAAIQDFLFSRIWSKRGLYRKVPPWTMHLPATRPPGSGLHRRRGQRNRVPSNVRVGWIIYKF